MKKTNKKLWIRALRSGEYRQGQGRLCDNNRFCCLGVAYDVLVDGEWERKNDYANRWGIREIAGSDSNLSTGMLPVYILDKIELDMYDVNSLVEMNDNGDSFEEIADWIEENVEVT